MLKQLSMPQKIFGAIVLRFAWLPTELAAADTPTGTIAFLSDRDLPPPFNDEIKVYLINTDGKNQQRLTENRHDDIDSAWFGPGFAVTPTGKKSTMWGWLKQVNR